MIFFMLNNVLINSVSVDSAIKMTMKIILLPIYLTLLHVFYFVFQKILVTKEYLRSS